MSTAASGKHREDVARPRRHVAAGTVRVVAAACSVILFVGFGYGWYNYRSLTTHTHTVTVSGLGPSTPAPGATPSPGLQHVDGAAQNILIVGLDSRAGLTAVQKRFYGVGEHDETTSTDTIIVVHVPANGSRATLLSIPRDTYVDIPGFNSNKINAAYVDGYDNNGGKTEESKQAAGISLLVSAVKNLTGLSIDHYVQVGFSGFVEIASAIGTIPIDLCEPVDDTAQHNQAHDIDGSSGFKMSAGFHRLTPQQALEFVRQRHNIPGKVSDDLGREARQRYFLKQAFAQIETAKTLLNPFALHRLIKAVDDAFTFDDRGGFGFQQFAEQISDLTAGNIAGSSIPTTGTQTYPSPVGSALTVDIGQVRAFAHHLFYPAPKARARTTGSATAKATTKPASSTAPSSPQASTTGNSGCVY